MPMEFVVVEDKASASKKAAGDTMVADEAFLKKFQEKYPGLLEKMYQRDLEADAKKK